jgi:hypothetical protein
MSEIAGAGRHGRELVAWEPRGSEALALDRWKLSRGKCGAVGEVILISAPAPANGNSR